MDADVFISLTHFKGHEMTGFGGRSQEHRHGLRLPGRQDGHAPRTASPLWTRNCAVAAIPAPKTAPTTPLHLMRTTRPISITTTAWAAAAASAPATMTPLPTPTTSALDDLNCKMAEYAKAVVDGRPCFHISIVNQVSPYCDCHGENDAAIIPGCGYVCFL